MYIGSMEFVAFGRGNRTLIPLCNAQECFGAKNNFYRSCLNLFLGQIRTEHVFNNLLLHALW